VASHRGEEVWVERISSADPTPSPVVVEREEEEEEDWGMEGAR